VSSLAKIENETQRRKNEKISWEQSINRKEKNK
jgi:hypothetical protein